MKILLANDDGYQAEGICVLRERLLRAGHDVYMCAPEGERSASGQAITWKQPLCARRIDEKTVFLSGTPADCVKFGLAEICPDADYVVSGINSGANAGADTLYSGTVGAAMEAVLQGKRAMAVSRDFYLAGGRYEAAAEIAARMLAVLEDSPLPEGMLVNLNVPALPLSQVCGIKPAFLSKVSVCAGYEKIASGWTGEWYLLQPGDMAVAEPGSDRALINEGFATVTLLKWDHGVSSASLEEILSHMDKEGFA